MHPLIRSIGKLCIAAFVIWHAFSVAIYTIPRESKDAFSIKIREKLIPIVAPYMFTTSQWQLWNLFAPDPLRRVTFYKLEIMRNGEWIEHELIQPGSYSVWRHATRFKMMGNTFDEFSENVMDLSIRYLQRTCEKNNMPDGTPIRMRYIVYVIPKNERPMPLSWWKQWSPKIETQDGPSTTCLSQP